MQKFPLRNRCKPNNNKAFGGSTDTHIRMRRDCCNNPHKMPPPSDAPQRLQRICQPIPSGTSLEKCQLSMEKPVKVCNRVFNEEAENVATWNDVLSKSRRGCKQSKSLPFPPSSSSAVSSALEVVVVESAKRQEPVQRITSAAPGGKLEVLCNVTASSSNTSNNNKNKNNNSDTNGNRNKDDYDDDDNNRRSRLDLEQQQQQQENYQSKTQAEAAIMSAAASARKFITFERLRLGDQINFLLFDPYRTLKFLITELKSRLKTVVPDDINVQKILVEIQQTIKRIRIPNNASETVLQPVATRIAINTKTTTNSTEDPPITARVISAKAVPVSTTEAGVKYILPPKERCHVIKNDPLKNHARKVNSSCQTIASQLENVNACQMCENHQVNHQPVGTVGCNQNRINEKNSIADDGMMHQDILYSTGVAYQERSKDHRKDTEVRESFSCKSLQDQDNVEILKIKNDPFSRDTQRIIAQLETELLNFQRELQKASSSSLSEPHGIRQRLPLGGSTQENSKVQSKRGPWLDKKREYPEQKDENKNEEEQEQTFHDFIADKLQLKFWKHCNRLNSSSTQTAAAAAAGALSISKESQTNLKSPTQMFCHLEKEKLLLIQKFRTSEMQTIQGDLNELHVFIKDQLNGIYQSITRENQNSKYFSNDQNRRRGPADKNKQKSRQKNFHTLQQTEKTQAAKGLPPPPLLSSSPSLTASTSSSSLSSQRIHEGGRIPLPSELRSALPRHYKKSSSSPIPADNGNANNTKSMMKQKSSSSLPSTADAKERHNISDVDKAGGKKSKNSHQQLYGQEHLFANCRAHCDGFTADTPFCSGSKKKHHFSNVDCRCRRRSSQLDAVTQINGNSKRMMSAMTSRTSTTKGDINSTSQTPGPGGPAVMTHYQRHQHLATTTGIAQDRIQLISSSLTAPAPPAIGAVMTAAPSYISTRTPDETSRNPDTVMNAAVKTIIKDAYATTVTAAATDTAPAAAGHSNGIREPSHQSRNSWQRVNLKNPTGCQMKKQICGADGYECTINNNNNDNRSNYPEIHDCQKYRANSINPFCGLCSAKMHEVGADNGATAFAAATASDEFNYDYDDNDNDDRGYGYDVGAGGDGPINWKGENKSLAVVGNFTCHPEKRQKQRHRHRREQTSRLLHCCVAQSAAFQTDLDEFKEFLDEIVLSTPRTE